MRLGRLSEEVHEEHGIELTPLIDIVFILLLFFVVTTTFSKELGLQIDRPAAREGEAVPNHVVRVAVDARGALTVNARPASEWRLEAEVREALAGFDTTDVLLVSDKHVDAGRLVELVDVCKRGGAKTVAVAVESKDGP